MIAAISLMRRRPDLTVEQFRRHWLDPHGVLTAGLPGTRFYVQHHPVPSSATNALARRLGIDGVPQLWFDDYAARHVAYTSPRIAACNVDSELFVGEVTRLVTEPVVVTGPSPMEPCGGHRGSADKGVGGPGKVLLVATGTPDAGWADAAQTRLARLPGVTGYVRHRLLEQAKAPASRIPELVLPVAGLAEVTFAAEAALLASLHLVAADDRTAVIRVEDVRLG